MRYQPAYTYPGAQKIVSQPVVNEPRWRFELPKLLGADQNRWVKGLRFLLVVFGMLAFIVGVAHYFTAQQAQTWGQTSVTITKAEVVRMKYNDSVPLFTAKIEYRYVVEGVVHMGTRLSVRPVRSANPADVKKQIAPFTVGRTVLARVNPNQPQRAFLKTDPLFYLQFMILPGLLLVALSLAIGQTLHVHAQRKRRRQWKFGDFHAPVMVAAV